MLNVHGVSGMVNLGPQELVPSIKQVELKRKNEYIPIFKYILSFKDSSS